MKRVAIIFAAAMVVSVALLADPPTTNFPVLKYDPATGNLVPSTTNGHAIGSSGSGLPSQSGNGSSIITTDGTTASWAVSPILGRSGSGGSLGLKASNGNLNTLLPNSSGSNPNLTLPSNTGTLALFSDIPTNLTSIATRNFSDLQNIPSFNHYTYFIRLVSGTPTAFDASGIQVSSNADTGALVNALMPTLSVNPKGAYFLFDRGAFPFATAIVHDTPTITNASAVVTSLAPIVIRGAGNVDPQDNGQPLNLNGTVFYPTSGFSSGSYLIKINPTPAAGKFAFGPIIENISILCTSGGAATFEPYTDHDGLAAGILINEPSSGHMRDVWVGSPKGNGIAILTPNFRGGGFLVDHCWVNAVKGTGNYGIIVDLSDCAVANSFVYFTAAGSTDYRLGKEDGDASHRYIGHVQATNCNSADSHGTVLELAGSCTVTGFMQNGNDTDSPAIFMKKTGTGQVVVSGSSFKNPHPGDSGTIVYQYVAGNGPTGTTIAGCSFDNVGSLTTLIDLQANVDATEMLRFSNCTIWGGAVPTIGAIKNTNGHTDYAAGNYQLGPVSSNISFFANFLDINPTLIGYLAGNNAWTGTNTFTQNGNAVNSLAVVNPNAGASAASRIDLTNDTGTVSYGLYSSGHTAYGAVSANSGFFYSPLSAGLTVMADNATGIIKWASGGNAERMRLSAAGGLSIGSTTDPGAGSLLLNGGNLTLSGNQSAAAWTTNGLRIKGSAGTLTDTSSSGTVAAAYTSVLGGNTIAASSATTFTKYAGLHLTDPIAGTNVTFTKKYALDADSIHISAANSYYSNDGTAGATSTTGGLTFKDGLYTAGSISSGLTIGSTAIASGSGSTNILYDNSGTLAEASKSSLGIAASGSNSDITALTGLTAQSTITLAPASNTVATGLLLTDTTAATSGNQQYSGAVRWTGQGWKTTATAASQAVDFRAYVVPVQGTTNPTAQWTLDSQVNGAGFGTALTYDTGGNLTLGGGYLAFTGTNTAPALYRNGNYIEVHRPSDNAFLFFKAGGMDTSGISLGSADPNQIQFNTSGLIKFSDVAISRNAAGVVEVNNGTAGTYRDLKLRTLIPGGTDVTCTGGTIGTGSKNHAGFVTSTTTGTSTIVITFTTTAPTGWNVEMTDQTTAADAKAVTQTASTTTTATLSGTTVSGDKLSYIAMPY